MPQHCEQATTKYFKSDKRKIVRFHAFIVWLGGPKVLGKLFGSPTNDKIMINQ